MVYLMNNTEVLQMLDDCEDELKNIQQSINELGYANIILAYLTRYAVIKACSTIERAFKIIIADYCSQNATQQVKTYLDKRVRASSTTPTYRNINALLSQFDSNWNEEFKNRIKNHSQKDMFLNSIQSLVDARNSIAHGSNNYPAPTISDTITYYTNFRIVMDILDDVVYTVIDN